MYFIYFLMYFKHNGMSSVKKIYPTKLHRETETPARSTAVQEGIKDA
jgi:hypothetical protein